jgi:hypothetical protein
MGTCTLIEVMTIRVLILTVETMTTLVVNSQAMPQTLDSVIGQLNPTWKNSGALLSNSSVTGVRR